MTSTFARAPKKYLDVDRTIVSEEWKQWRSQRNQDQYDQAEALLPGSDNHAVYFPEEHDKDLGEGAWIFVIDPPNGSVALDFEIPVLSLWYARPHLLSSGRFAGRNPYQGIIQTPAGDLHLWPHEYMICRDIKNLLGFDGVTINSLGGDPVLDEDQLWYLMSRGISRQDATVMLFDQIKSQNYCYVTLPDYAVQMFAGVGTSLRSHVHRRPR